MNYSSCRSGFLEVSHFSKKISVFGNLKTVWFWCFQIVQNICICIHMLLNKSRNVYIASSCIDLCKCINYCDAMNILILLLLLCFDCLFLPGICICIMNHWQHIWKHTRYQFNMFCPDLKIATGKTSELLFVLFCVVVCVCLLLHCIYFNTHQYTSTHTSAHITTHQSVHIRTNQHTSAHISLHIQVNLWVHTSKHTTTHINTHISAHLSTHTSTHINTHSSTHINTHSFSHIV